MALTPTDYTNAVNTVMASAVLSTNQKNTINAVIADCMARMLVVEPSLCAVHPLTPIKLVVIRALNNSLTDAQLFAKIDTGISSLSTYARKFISLLTSQDITTHTTASGVTVWPWALDYGDTP